MMELIVAHPFLYQRGGAEKVVLEIAKRFNPVIYSVIYQPENTFPEFRDFDVRVLPASLLEKPFFFMGNDIRRSGAIAAGFRYYFTKIREDYDVINAHGTPSEWIRNRNERVCWYCHTPNREAFDLHEFRMKEFSLQKKALNAGLLSAYKAVEFQVVPKIEKIVTNSEISNQRISNYLKRRDAEIIHPGVDPKQFRNDGYGNYFLYPSRITPEKRFEYVLEAFRVFSAAQKQKRWKLMLAGFLQKNERELRYFEKLKKLANGLNIEFRLDADSDELLSLYANAYAVLFSAINEDWGLVPLEAMASEKPCISVKEGGPTYSIIDGETGYLVNSPLEMAQRMLALAGDPDKNETMGKAGRARILKNYTWDIFLAGMESAFRSVAGGKT